MIDLADKKKYYGLTERKEAMRSVLSSAGVSKEEYLSVVASMRADYRKGTKGEDGKFTYKLGQDNVVLDAHVDQYHAQGLSGAKLEAVKKAISLADGKAAYAENPNGQISGKDIDYADLVFTQEQRKKLEERDLPVMQKMLDAPESPVKREYFRLTAKLIGRKLDPKNPVIPEPNSQGLRYIPTHETISAADVLKMAEWNVKYASKKKDDGEPELDDDGAPVLQEWALNHIAEKSIGMLEYQRLKKGYEAGAAVDDDYFANNDQRVAFMYVYNNEKTEDEHASSLFGMAWGGWKIIAQSVASPFKKDAAPIGETIVDTMDNAWYLKDRYFGKREITEGTPRPRGDGIADNGLDETVLAQRANSYNTNQMYGEIGTGIVFTVATAGAGSGITATSTGVKAVTTLTNVGLKAATATRVVSSVGVAGSAAGISFIDELPSKDGSSVSGSVKFGAFAGAMAYVYETPVLRKYANWTLGAMVSLKGLFWLLGTPDTDKPQWEYRVDPAGRVPPSSDDEGDVPIVQARTS